VDDEHGDEERGDAVRPFGPQSLVVREERLEAPDARSHEDAEARGVHAVRLQGGVLDGHHRAGHRVLEEGIELSFVLLVDVLERVEALELAGDARVEPRGVEPRDGADARAALEEALPEFLRGIAHGGDGAHPGDHNPALVHGVSGTGPGYWFSLM